MKKIYLSLELDIECIRLGQGEHLMTDLSSIEGALDTDMGNFGPKV